MKRKLGAKILLIQTNGFIFIRLIYIGNRMLWNKQFISEDRIFYLTEILDLQWCHFYILRLWSGIKK